MTRMTNRFAVSSMLLILSATAWSDDATNATKDEGVSEITVRAVRVANESPASTYATPATALRFDPLTELQSRGIAEGQSDVTVRGGLFENTGFKLGASTIMDPQTGHYVAELPVDPSMMSAPAIYKGIDAAVEGFNSAVATVSYGINRVRDGGYVSLGAGSDNLNFQSFRFAHTNTNSTGNDVGVAVSLARSEGDGSVDFGDHEFARATVQLQHATGSAQTDLIVAYQDKFFGWPGAYTGFEGLQQSGRISWRYGGQITSDELVRSTDLTNGSFTDRTYATLSIVPSIESNLAGGSRLVWRAGATLDYSDQDTSAVSPLLGVTLSRPDAGGSINYSLEYAQTSQVPGYTALNSNPTGLFGGNPLLGREKAQQIAASIERDTGDWQLRATVFSRRDDSLVDWTYATGAPFARQANAVDIDVIGFEAFFVRSGESLDVAIGYTALDKDADYGTAQVDASFYALNFARHRATLAIVYRFAGGFEFRLDNEYRSQEANPLRVGDDSTYLASASLRWAASGDQRFSAALVVDNATDSEYQPFPGTPASGRQLSLSASYGW